MSAWDIILIILSIGLLAGLGYFFYKRHQDKQALNQALALDGQVAAASRANDSEEMRQPLNILKEDQEQPRTSGGVAEERKSGMSDRSSGAAADRESGVLKFRVQRD